MLGRRKQHQEPADQHFHPLLPTIAQANESPETVDSDHLPITRTIPIAGLEGM